MRPNCELILSLSWEFATHFFSKQFAPQERKPDGFENLLKQ